MKIYLQYFSHNKTHKTCFIVSQLLMNVLLMNNAVGITQYEGEKRFLNQNYSLLI